MGFLCSAEKIVVAWSLERTIVTARWEELERGVALIGLSFIFFFVVEFQRFSNVFLAFFLSDILVRHKVYSLNGEVGRSVGCWVVDSFLFLGNTSGRIGGNWRFVLEFHKFRLKISKLSSLSRWKKNSRESWKEKWQISSWNFGSVGVKFEDLWV